MSRRMWDLILRFVSQISARIVARKSGLKKTGQCPEKKKIHLQNTKMKGFSGSEERERESSTLYWPEIPRFYLKFLWLTCSFSS